MNQEDHLSGEALEKWTGLAFSYQMKHAYHLSTDCATCWSVVDREKLAQPRAYDDPFLRALARIGLQPKVDLSLPSQSLRLFVHPPFRRTDVPQLLLQESIELGLRSSGPNRVANFLSLPSALAELMREGGSETRPAGTDLKVNVGCAAVQFYLLGDDTEKAEKALGEARDHFQDSSDYTRVNLKLAEFALARRTNRSRAMEVMNDLTDNEFPGLVYDPVRRFEISCVLARKLNRVGPVDNEDNASWPLSELGLGSFGDELQRLNALFAKARFAAAVALTSDLPRAVASELERDYESVKRRGDAYSLGLYHQLFGELRRDKSALKDALDIYSSLELEDPFVQAWLKLDNVLTEVDPTEVSNQRSTTSKLAQSVFGKEAAQRMARIIYATDTTDREVVA